MMKKLSIAAALLFSLHVSAELKVELTLDRAEAVTGEKVGFHVRVTNTAATPVEATFVVDTGDAQPLQLLLTSVWDGWHCSSQGLCDAAAFPANGVAEFGGFVITPSAVAPQFGVRVTAHASDGTNDTEIAPLPVSAAARAADLVVSSESQEVQLAGGAEVRYPVMVRNAGPDEAQNITAWVRIALRAPSRFLVTGAGWTCSGSVCTRPSLAAGQEAPLEVAMTAPEADATTQLLTHVYALNNLDANGARTVTTFYVGDRQAWRMRLAPLSLAPVQGANGSLWKTEMTMLIRASTGVEVKPDGCEPGPFCAVGFHPMPGEPFDPTRVWPAAFVGEHFVWVRAADFDKVAMNARVYDAGRAAQSAGAEVPMPRDEEFTSGILTMLSIPVEPQYRHTLRIYDDAARDGSHVVIRVYAGGEFAPRATVVQTLKSKDPALRVTSARLPVYPAMAQLNLDQLLPLGGIESLRVEIEPVEPDARIWSFVSITNNDTHHVTTVTPQ